MFLTFHYMINLVLQGENFTFDILTDWRLIAGVISVLFGWLPAIVAIRILCCRERRNDLQSPYARLRTTTSGKYLYFLKWI